MARVYTMFPVCAITVVLVASVQCGMTAAVANTTLPPSPILLRPYCSRWSVQEEAGSACACSVGKEHRYTDDACVYTMFPVCAITVVFVASVQCGMTAAVVNTTSPPSPILLIHGITGSQLEANVQGASQSLCNTGGDYELLWVSLVKLAKLIVGINCLDHGIKLNYDAATNTYTANAGVSV